MNFILPAAPVTLTHVALSFCKYAENCFSILDLDGKITVLIPVYNEQKQIESTLDSIINQTNSPGQIIISDNGSTDATPQIVKRYLENKGYSLQKSFSSFSLPVISVYTNLYYPPITLVRYKSQTSKAKSINKIKKFGLIKHERTLIVDSDTVLDSKFIEEISKYYYTLRLHKDKAFIVRSNILGATALPKRNAEAGLQEKIVAMGREAEYTFGHFLVRKGQNHTALYVAAGCGSMCSTHLLNMSNRTVADDLELTQRIQSNKAVKKLTQKNLEAFLKKRLMVITPQGNKVLAHVLKKFGDQVYFIDNLATYVPSALMYTQDPRSLKGLLRQIYRWSSGFHQVMYLEGKKFTQKNRKIAFTMYGAFLEGLLGSFFFLVFPILILYEIRAGYSPVLGYLFRLYLLDAILQLAFIGISMYQRNRLQGIDKPQALKRSVIDTVKNLPFFMLYDSSTLPSFYIPI